MWWCFGLPGAPVYNEEDNELLNWDIANPSAVNDGTSDDERGNSESVEVVFRASSRDFIIIWDDAEEQDRFPLFADIAIGD